MKDETILVVNAGSTSTKYKFFNQKGNIIFDDIFRNKDLKDKKKEEKFLQKVKKVSKNQDLKIAFRVVHGGDFSGIQVINNELIKKIKEFKVFAPIHNKIVLKKINKLKKFFPGVFEENNFLAAFDTSFHRTMPEEFYTYPINPEINKKYKIRKYGFHGLAVQSVLRLARDGFEKREKKIPEKIIVAHLGGGSSITAIKNNKSVANSMGLTPISGLMMTTRVGDVDSDLDKILSIKMARPLNWVSDMLSRKSGFLGMTGSLDTKEIFDKAKKEEENRDGIFRKEKLAFDIYLEQLVEKISGYAGILGGVDLLIFSGGIGEGNSYLRKKVLDRLKFLELDRSKILVFKAEEEEEIFKQIILL